MQWFVVNSFNSGVISVKCFHPLQEWKKKDHYVLHVGAYFPCIWSCLVNNFYVILFTNRVHKDYSSWVIVSLLRELFSKFFFSSTTQRQSNTLFKNVWLNLITARLFTIDNPKFISPSFFFSISSNCTWQSSEISLLKKLKCKQIEKQKYTTLF